MIEITAGFTSISAGTDRIDVLAPASSPTSAVISRQRRPTGARVTVDFHRTSSLLPMQVVRVRYDFGADGNLREMTGIPAFIRTVAWQRRAVLYYYRLSQWIPAAELMVFAAETRLRKKTGQAETRPELRADRVREC